MRSGDGNIDWSAAVSVKLLRPEIKPIDNKLTTDEILKTADLFIFC